MGALEGTGMQAGALFTYLANSLRVGERTVPYSLVTALDISTPFNNLHRPAPSSPQAPLS